MTTFPKFLGEKKVGVCLIKHGKIYNAGWRRRIQFLSFIAAKLQKALMDAPCPSAYQSKDAFIVECINSNLLITKNCL
jgi:hypothetical protein